LAIDIGDFGGDIADWGGDIINRDLILDFILDLVWDRIGDIPVGDLPQVSEFVDIKIANLGKRKGLAPSSKQLAALRKTVIDRVGKGR
jgi:hypothetical protein